MSNAKNLSRVHLRCDFNVSFDNLIPPQIQIWFLRSKKRWSNNTRRPTKPVTLLRFHGLCLLEMFQVKGRAKTQENAKNTKSVPRMRSNCRLTREYPAASKAVHHCFSNLFFQDDLVFTRGYLQIIKVYGCKNFGHHRANKSQCHGNKEATEG